MPAASPAIPLVRAAQWMSGTLVSFTAMAIAVRELSAVMGSFEILFFRSLIGLAVVAAVVGRTGWKGMRTRRPGLHLVRNLVHFGGQFGWVYGIALLPLAEVFAIEFTLPIWAAILAVLLLGERMNRGRYAAVILGFGGILVILRPGVAIIDPAALVVLASAMLFAGAHTGTKALTATEKPLVILLYMSVIQLPLGLVPALLDWATPGVADAPWLAILGVSGLTAHYCLARAFLHADATIVMPMDFLRLPLIAVVGYLAYAEAIEIWTLAGAALIFAGNYYMLRREARTKGED